METDIPIPIHAIDTQLKARCVDATLSGINTALRRNPEYFEQLEKGKWQLRAGKQLQALSLAREELVVRRGAVWWALLHIVGTAARETEK